MPPPGDPAPTHTFSTTGTTIASGTTSTTGPASAPSAAIAPLAAVAPSAPSWISNTTPVSKSTTLTWGLPANGGSPITSFTVTNSSGATVCTVTSVPVGQSQFSCLASNLATGVNYFYVVATNAVVMTHRGSTTTRRYATAEDYFATLDGQKAATARAIFAAITEKVKGLELVTARNQPMLRAESGYVFGLSAATNHLTLNPFSAAVMTEFAERLHGYRCG
ncbi:MAG: fibronectin type III domain-containing protein, partial [Acidobacteria bacterium]|nr:fibronectin type III domain-containing protein [Acidobacteriota bacterium]